MHFAQLTSFTSSTSPVYRFLIWICSFLFRINFYHRRIFTILLLNLMVFNLSLVGSICEFLYNIWNTKLYAYVVSCLVLVYSCSSQCIPCYDILLTYYDVHIYTLCNSYRYLRWEAGHRSSEQQGTMTLLPLDTLKTWTNAVGNIDIYESLRGKRA